MCGPEAAWDLDGMLRIALAVIALRVLADSTHPVAVVPLALAAWLVPRLRPGARGALAITLGVIGLATSADAVYYTRELGLRAGDITGWLALAAGAALIGDGARTLYESRRGGRWRHPRRAALAAGGAVGAAVALTPVVIGYVETHVARAGVPADRLGVAHETVRFETADGLTLEGWYIPSRNGAAVISFPGRKGPQRQARMLAGHGYGVLLFDRRGEGRSDGTPNAWGWGGDEDIKAAVRYLRTRGDVDPRRIGGIGLSVGGELMLEAAAEDRGLAAVVSEGAGARTMAEELDRAPPAAADRGPGQPERRGPQPPLLRAGARAQGALGDPGRRARQRHRRPPRRVRAQGRGLLRQRPLTTRAPAAPRCDGRPQRKWSRSPSR
jgi:hypothetical protein